MKKRFAEEIETAPRFMQDDFVEMYGDLEVVPRSGDRYKVIASEEEPNGYHMLFDVCLAWIFYTVEDNPQRMVTVYRLVNARDLL